MFHSVHHISFTVGEMERSIAFYQMLGFCLASDRRHLTADYLQAITGYPDAEMHVAYLSGMNVQLELIQYVQPVGVDLDKTNYYVGSAHICFEVADIYEAYETLRLQGVRFRSFPVEIRQGPNAGRGAVYFYDPDGYTLELAAPIVSSQTRRVD